MNKKVMIIILSICLLVIIGIFYINSNLVYLGYYTKVLSFGNKIITFNNNTRITLREGFSYSNGSIKKGYIKSNNNSLSNDYYFVNKDNKNMNLYPFIASGIFKKIDVIVSNDDIGISSSTLDNINSLFDNELSLEDIYSYKEISYDIDNDSSEEKVVYLVYHKVDSIITSIFLLDNDNPIEFVSNEEDLESENQSKSFNLTCLIDFNNDRKYEIIVSENNGDSQPTYYNIYQYNDGKVKEIK